MMALFGGACKVRNPSIARMDAAGGTSTRERTDWARAGFGVTLGAFAAYQQFKLPPILPEFLRDYPHSPVVAAGFMSVYALVGLIASAPIGRRLDRAMGPALVLLFALTVIGVTLALAVPQSAVVMLLSRGVEGLAFAFAALAAPTIASAAAKPRDLPLVTGLLAGWIPMGQIVAALAALLFGDWHWLWWAGLGMTFPLGVWAWRLMRHSPAADGSARKPRAPGRLPTVREKRGLVMAGGIFLLWSTQYFAFMTWLTQYLTGSLGLGRNLAVLAYLLPVVVLLVCNILTGLALRHGLRLIPALLVALAAQAAVWAAQPWLAGGIGVLALIVYGIGAGIAPTCLFHLPHAIAAVAERDSGETKPRGSAGAAYFGILMTGRNIGVFLGPILLATLIGGQSYALDLGWTSSARIFAAVTLAAAVVAAALAPRLRTDTHHT
jgi:predicted MFS family arabinose efflux permease